MARPSLPRHRGLLAAVLVLLWCSGARAADSATRSGFTVKLSLGGGLTAFDGDAGWATDGGLGGPNLAIGGFVNRHLAVLVNLSGVYLFPRGDLGFVSVGGPTIQWWLNERVQLEGGIGYAFVHAERPAVGDNGRDLELTSGLGIDLGAGVVLWTIGSGLVGLYVDFATVITREDNGMTFQGGVMWQQG